MSIAYKSAGAGVSTETSGGALSPACPATVDANDILIAHVYYEGTADAPSTPSGWTLLNPGGTAYVVETTIGRHWVFGRIADGSEDGAAVAFGTAGGTNQRGARIYSFSGWVAGAITDIVGGFSHQSHATDPQAPTVTTIAAGDLAVAFTAQNDNNTIGNFTGETGGDWTEAVAEYTAALTPGLMLQLQTCTPTSNPGTVSGGTFNTANDPVGTIGFYIQDGSTKIWVGSGGDENWSTGANWSGGTVPSSTTAAVIFNGTSTKNCTVDNLGTFTGPITVASGYTGTITQSINVSIGAFSIAAGTWTKTTQTFTCATFGMSGGTFNGGSGAMATGAVTFSAGTLTATSGTWTISAASFTQTGSPTFTHNSGTIAFTGGTAATLTAPNCTFNLITFSKTNVNFTVASGTTCPLGTDPTNSVGSGTFDASGTVTWTGEFTLTGSITTAATTTITLSGFAPSISLNGSLTFNASATITTGLIVEFTGAGTSTITATAYSFGDCVINKSASGNVTVAASTTFPLGTNAFTSTFGTLTVNGTLSTAGSFDCNGNLVFGATGVLSGVLSLIELEGDLNINASATFANGIILLLDGAGTATTLTASGRTFGTSSIEKTGTGNVTIASGSTLPLGANPNITIGNGALLIQSGGTLTWSGVLTNTGTDGNFNVQNGGTISGGCTGYVGPGSITYGATAVFPAGFNNTFHAAAGGATCTFTGNGNTTFGFLKRTGTFGGLMLIVDSNTFTYIEDYCAVTHELRFQAGSTTTLTDARPFRVRTTSSFTISITSSTSTNHTFVASNGSAYVNCDNLFVNNVTAPVSPVFYAGASSASGGDAPNWNFGDAPHLSLNAGPGSYSVSGADATFTLTEGGESYSLNAEPGSFTVSGADANLVYTPDGAVAYGLVAEPGSFEVSGAAAVLVHTPAGGGGTGGGGAPEKYNRPQRTNMRNAFMLDERIKKVDEEERAKLSSLFPDDEY